jgi:hypothetical protein
MLVLGTFWKTGMRLFSFACFSLVPLAALAVSQVPGSESLVVSLPLGVTAAEVQKALDALPVAGGEVILPPGQIDVSQPIVLECDDEALCGAGVATVLWGTCTANFPWPDPIY